MAQRVDAASKPWGPSLDSGFGFLTNTVKAEMVLTLWGRWGGLEQRRNVWSAASWHKKIGLCGCQFSASFLFFLFLSATQINVSFTWPRSEVYYLKKKKKTQPQNLLGEQTKAKRWDLGESSFVQNTSVDWGEKMKAFQIHSTHMDPAQDCVNISDKGIHSHPFIYHHHSISPYSFHVHLISALFF